MWKADRLRDHRDRLRKGYQVHVAGRLRTRTWEDREGHKRQRTEVACFAGDVILLAPAQAGAATDPGEGARSGKRVPRLRGAAMTIFRSSGPGESCARATGSR